MRVILLKLNKRKEDEWIRPNLFCICTPDNEKGYHGSQKMSKKMPSISFNRRKVVKRSPDLG